MNIKLKVRSKKIGGLCDLLSRQLICYIPTLLVKSEELRLTEF